MVRASARQISTAMRWHRPEILTTQWRETGGSKVQILAGWSTRVTDLIFMILCQVEANICDMAFLSVENVLE